MLQRKIKEPASLQQIKKHANHRGTAKARRIETDGITAISHLRK